VPMSRSRGTPVTCSVASLTSRDLCRAGEMVTSESRLASRRLRAWSQSCLSCFSASFALGDVGKHGDKVAGLRPAGGDVQPEGPKA